MNDQGHLNAHSAHVTPNPRFWIGAPREPGEPELIPGFLHRHACLLITGETNIGKTLVGLEIAYTLLTGTPLWGKLKPTRVLKYVTFIMGEHDKETLQTQWALLGFDPPEGLWVIPPPGRRLVAHGDTMVGNLDLYREWCQGSDLVMFDPLGAFASGEDIENDNAQMRAVISAMEVIAAPGALIAFAHMGKPAYDPKEGRYRQRETYATRGGSAIEDAVLDCFYMEADTDHGGYKLRQRKYKGSAPSFYRLTRDPATLRHTLVGQGATSSQLLAQRKAAIASRYENLRKSMTNP